MTDIVGAQDIYGDEANLLIESEANYGVDREQVERPRSRYALKRPAVSSSFYSDDPERGRGISNSPFRPPSGTATLLRFTNGSLPWYKSASIYLLLPGFLILTLSYGGLIAPKLNLLLSLICRVHYAEQDLTTDELLKALADMDRNCQTAAMHARVSKFNMSVSLIHGILAAVISPKMGVLSDRIGRCPVLAITALGPLMSNLILILAAKSTSVYGYRWFLVGAVFDGLSGSVAAMMATAHAYATDCTPPEKRATVFGLFHACLFTGMAIGPAFGGYLVKATGSILSTFYAAILAQIVFVCFVLFVIPESVSYQHRLDAQEVHRLNREFNSGRPRDVREFVRRINFLQPLRILVPQDGTRSVIKKNLMLLSFIDMLLIGVGAGGMMVIILYAEFTFGWSSTEAGYFMSIGGSVRAFMLVILLPAITKFLRARDPDGLHHVGASFSDITIIRFAIACEFIAYFGYMVSRNSVQFALSGCLGAIGGIVSPTLQSTLTKHVAKENVGALLGALSLLHCICQIIAPIIFSTIYAYTVGSYPKAVFLAFLFLFGTVFVCSLFIAKNVESSLYDDDEILEGVLAHRDDYELLSPNTRGTHDDADDD
ncbi:major facilitator superfamily domain-containing protein [Lipomyces tetrasporus]|uniref:Major facilitator superfamily domain-containing protein n=1 Tax=Lipomyces tetrasporus TaxID=54092 RepID=A0AAD7VUH7_9ASCO|nr:major facilitator superfamily domain-containing protein [Lipomyces tetrasporus]KAJ8101844.1 major facilitator superfamily domain-containing protein [Lipomyces tetrasporus]